MENIHEHISDIIENQIRLPDDIREYVKELSIRLIEGEVLSSDSLQWMNYMNSDYGFRMRFAMAFHLTLNLKSRYFFTSDGIYDNVLGNLDEAEHVYHHVTINGIISFFERCDDFDAIMVFDYFMDQFKINMNIGRIRDIRALVKIYEKGKQASSLIMKLDKLLDGFESRVKQTLINENLKLMPAKKEFVTDFDRLEVSEICERFLKQQQIRQFTDDILAFLKIRIPLQLIKWKRFESNESYFLLENGNNPYQVLKHAMELLLKEIEQRVAAV